LNSERQINNLQNSLPLKKQRDLIRRKEVESNKMDNFILFGDYKQPNIFPKRKSSPKILQYSKGR